MSVLPAIRIEGGLLGPETLDQLLAGELPGQKPRDFGLDSRQNLTDEIASVFADARAQWQLFRHRLTRLPDTDPATSLTRDAWMVPFLSFLGYQLRYNPRAHELDGATFAISHRAGENEDAPPVHIVGLRQELGRVAPTGRPRLAPHSLVQEFLNRSEHLWGLVTNGQTLRILRDSTYIRRQAYLEFDLGLILEEQRFNEFVLLYRLLHRTRLPRSAADARDCFLEHYYQHALEQGGHGYATACATAWRHVSRGWRTVSSLTRPTRNSDTNCRPLPKAPTPSVPKRSTDSSCAWSTGSSSFWSPKTAAWSVLIPSTTRITAWAACAGSWTVTAPTPTMTISGAVCACSGGCLATNDWPPCSEWPP